MTSKVIAKDWKFASIAEFESQLDTKHHANGVRLFQFTSPINEITGYVLFSGIGYGSGLKFAVSKQILSIGLESLERLAKPSIGSEVRFSLARAKVPETDLEFLTVNTPFSLSDLNFASGQVEAAGVGLGIGVGMLMAEARTATKTLFSCTKLGVEFGRIGVNVTVLKGKWLVVHDE